MLYGKGTIVRLSPIVLCGRRRSLGGISVHSFHALSAEKIEDCEGICLKVAVITPNEVPRGFSMVHGPAALSMGGFSGAWESWIMNVPPHWGFRIYSATNRITVPYFLKYDRDLCTSGCCVLVLGSANLDLQGSWSEPGGH